MTNTCKLIDGVQCGMRSPSVVFVLFVRTWKSILIFLVTVNVFTYAGSIK